jgi:hypothetical protein
MPIATLEVTLGTVRMSFLQVTHQQPHEQQQQVDENSTLGTVRMSFLQVASSSHINYRTGSSSSRWATLLLLLLLWLLLLLLLIQVLQPSVLLQYGPQWSFSC